MFASWLLLIGQFHRMAIILCQIEPMSTFFAVQFGGILCSLIFFSHTQFRGQVLWRLPLHTYYGANQFRR